MVRMQWYPVDIIVMTITVCLCLMLVTTIAAPYITGMSLSEEKAKLVGSVVQAMVSVVTLFVGAKIQKHSNTNETKHTP